MRLFVFKDDKDFDKDIEERLLKDQERKKIT